MLEKINELDTLLLDISGMLNELLLAAPKKERNAKRYYMVYDFKGKIRIMRQLLQIARANLDDVASAIATWPEHKAG